MSLFEKCMERLNSMTEEEAKKYWHEFNFDPEHYKRVLNYTSDLSQEEIDSLFESFLVWEKNYEESWYKRGVLNSSNIFGAICKLAENKGADCYHVIQDKDFLGGAWEYKGYRFSVFNGQGSFWRIEKYNQNKELEHLFTTT